LGHFRAIIQGQRGPVSRLGSKKSGVQASVNGWNVGVDVSAYYDEKKQCDVIVVELTGGSNARFSRKEIGRFTIEDLRKGSN